jgi:hypothetical protein
MFQNVSLCYSLYFDIFRKATTNMRSGNFVKYVFQSCFFFPLFFFFRDTSSALQKNRGASVEVIITPPPPSSRRVFESEMHVLCNDVPISRTIRTDGVAVYLWVPSLIFIIDVEIFGALGQYVLDSPHKTTFSVSASYSDFSQERTAVSRRHLASRRLASFLLEQPLLCFPQRVPYCVCSRVFVRNFRFWIHFPSCLGCNDCNACA